MKFKQGIYALLALSVMIAPLSAEVDFEWRLNLNNRYHADPYEYRYDLAERFRLPESRVIGILKDVREPSDAYMIFRLAEMSEKPYDYVLNVYRQNRYATWLEIAALLGVQNSSDFNALKHQHDLRDDYPNNKRRYNRYEDKGIIIKREEIYIPQQDNNEQKRYHESRQKSSEYDNSNDNDSEGRRRH